MGVRLSLDVVSALLATQSVFRSHDGTTCCGLTPTRNLSITFSVAGSITQTSLLCRLGTYTRGRWPFTASLRRPAPISLYKLEASATPGMPGTVSTASTGLAGGAA